jgi:hypothetical protein
MFGAATAVRHECDAVLQLLIPRRATVIGFAIVAALTARYKPMMSRSLSSTCSSWAVIDSRINGILAGPACMRATGKRSPDISFRAAKRS